VRQTDPRAVGRLGRLAPPGDRRQGRRPGPDARYTSGMKRVAPALILLCLAAGGWAASALAQNPATDAPPPSLADARQALSSGRTADALRMAGQIVRNAPRSRDAAELQIQVLVRLEDVPRAAAAYDRYVGLVGKPDAALLGSIALEQLHITADNALDDPRLAVAALERLARAGDAWGKERLERLAIDDAGTTAAVLADGALARLGDNAAAARLSALVSSERLRDKTTLTEELGSLGSKANLGDLRALLQDPDPLTRMAAMTALGDLGDKGAIAAVRALLSDDYPPVRSHAALTLKRLGDSEGNEAVARMMASPVGDVRLDALAADRSVRDADRRSMARAILSDPDPHTQIKAARALAASDPDAARVVLNRLAADPDVSARRGAVRALEDLQPVDLVLFRRLLGDPSEWVRVHAAGGILAAVRKK
jgi:HEAT repeat protein